MREINKNYIQAFNEAQKQGKNLMIVKARQVGMNNAAFVSALASQVEREAKMILEHFKMLLMETYLEGGFNAKQHSKIEQLLNSEDADNQKLGIKLIEQQSGKTIELVHKKLDNGTRETATRTVTKTV